MNVTNFEEEDLADVLAQIPDDIKPLVMTTYDRIVSQGLEKGLEKGLELKTIQAIRNMHKEGLNVTTIARVLEVDPAFVRHILDSKPDEKNGQ